jgi:hypothetical protein
MVATLSVFYDFFVNYESVRFLPPLFNGVGGAGASNSVPHNNFVNPKIH